MTNPYFDVTIVSRGGGRSAVATAAYDSGSKLTSAVASAAYRSGEALYDAQAEKTFDYRRKEHVVHTEIIAPGDVPDWVNNRQTLWNTVEQTEKRKDAQLARSIIAALPRELSHEQNIQLVRDYVNEQFVSRGMVADFAVHDKDASDGGRNPHVHIMLTLRDVSAEGFGKKNREWNNQQNVTLWRNSWEQTANAHLEAAGYEDRVSLQSYAAQGIDKTPEQHMGYKVAELENKGIETRIGNTNREIKQENAVREAARASVLEPEPPYSQEDIDAYYQSEWERASAIYEPDIANVERADRPEPIQEEQRAGRWERVVTEARTTSTWYGSTETFLTYGWRRVTENLSNAAAEEKHETILRQTLFNTVYDAVRETAESIWRVANQVKDKIGEYASNVYERYADWATRVQERREDKDLGYER